MIYDILVLYFDTCFAYLLCFEATEKMRSQNIESGSEMSSTIVATPLATKTLVLL